MSRPLLPADDTPSAPRAHRGDRLPVVPDWPMGDSSPPERLALEWALRLTAGDVRVLALASPGAGSFLQSDESRLAEVRERVRRSFEERATWPAGPSVPAVALRLLGHDFRGLPVVLPGRGSVELGLLADANVPVTEAVRARARALDGVLVGNTWMREQLAAGGIHTVGQYPTAIDTALFRPADRSGLMPGAFVVFAAGPLAYDKGPDLVLAAVRAFRARRPETVLVTAWQTAFPELVAELPSGGHVATAPRLHRSQLAIVEWAVAHGLPARAVADLGYSSDALLARMLPEADVALFPGRGEPDLNPYLLQALACGVPTIASRCPGQADIPPALLSGTLACDRPLADAMRAQRPEGWGEPAVEAIVEQLELVYQQRDAARRAAGQQAGAMAAYGWDAAMERTRDLLRPFT
jgi:glycosyltransferase involved in cell wall biosynthesis